MPSPSQPFLFACYVFRARSIQVFWINPLTWAFRSAVLNEFQSPEYDDECVNDVSEGAECQTLGQVCEMKINMKRASGARFEFASRCLLILYFHVQQ